MSRTHAFERPDGLALRDTVLRLLEAGSSLDEVAEAVGVSSRTVRRMGERDPKVEAALEASGIRRRRRAAEARAEAVVEAALQPVVVREVIEPEVMPRELPAAADGGQERESPRVGERVMDSDELLERLTMAGRDEKHPAHVLALKLLSDVLLVPEIERRKVEARLQAQAQAAARKRSRGNPSQSLARSRIEAIMSRRGSTGEAPA